MSIVVGLHGTMPTRGSAFAAGWDLYAAEDVSIASWAAVETDIKVGLPEGTYGRIAPRSGLAFKKGAQILAGVIDQDYRGTLKVIIFNPQDELLVVSKGDRIAQLILEKYDDRPLEQVTELPSTERGGAGFGSSGV